MVALRDDQHELVAADGTSLLLFGTEDTGYLCNEHPQIDSDDGVVGDTNRVREDGYVLGEDYLGPKTAIFDIHVLAAAGATDPRTIANAAVNRMRAVWESKTLRYDPLAYAVLRSQITPGVTRRAYGRPRQFASTYTATSRKGWTPALGNFYVPDGSWYDDAAQTVQARVGASTDGGLIGPLVGPLTSTQKASGNGVVTIGGQRSTWAVVTFQAPPSSPVTNPSLRIGDAFTVGFTGVFPAGAVWTWDSRPWARTVLRTDGGSYAGRLSYDTPSMRDAYLDPGTYPLTLTGIDTSASLSVTVEWRNAWPGW